MTNPMQHHGWLSGTTLRAASAALALAAVLVSVITMQSAQAQTFTPLHSFDYTDGNSPFAGLVQATNGNFYGTTFGGLDNSYGTVFKITPSGTLATPHSFTSSPDGANPDGALVQATNGDFYGTTYAGGANGYGAVFKMTPSGTLTTLYSFDGTDGFAPAGAVVQATDGNFYGTTTYGGANSCIVNGTDLGCGTVFKITPGGMLTTLYSFCSQSGCTDGEFPFFGVLVQATNGDFYGTASSGGANGFGTVFKITPSGTLTTLYSFCSQSGCTDGQDPIGWLVQAANGNLYGTTVGGGANGDGTVFKITPSGTLTTLHSFDVTDGAHPDGALVQATNGNFYGTTYGGGANNAGTIFKMTPSGTVTTLYSFCAQSGCTDGAHPYAALVQDTNGNFYGTTAYGGASSACPNGCGTVFSLSVGLGPFVETKPTSGTEGTKIGILGQGFGSSSVVKFGGTKATTIVRSGTTFITATVPAGALTGAVTVTTGSTTLSSAQAFKVKPTITSFAPPSGPVGTSVSINGTGLTQATRVAFNGTSASFTVNSDILITATVPTGATTGKIAVTTKGGSATSTTSFKVN